MERPVRLELTYADWQSTVLAAGRRTLERAAGIGPATGGLEDHDSTTELRPLTTKMVGALGFQPRVSRSQGERISRLSHAPKIKKPRILLGPGPEFCSAAIWLRYPYRDARLY